MERRHLELFRKETKEYELRFTKNNVPTDITGWVIYFTVKEKMSDIDNNAKIKKDVSVHLSAIEGKTLIELSDTDTDIIAGSYVYDIKYVDTDGNKGVLIHGRLKVLEPVTQRG